MNLLMLIVLLRSQDLRNRAPKAACKYVDPDDPARLVELLQNEAKVI
jgi:hypothetical protein